MCVFVMSFLHELDHNMVCGFLSFYLSHEDLKHTVGYFTGLKYIIFEMNKNPVADVAKT